MGGEYVKGNTITVDNSECDKSVQTHPMWHFTLWQLYGLKEDYLAWKGLAGMIGKEEIIREIQAETMRRVAKSLPREHFVALGKENAKKLASWWESQPKERRVERSRKAGAANKGQRRPNCRNGALAQSLEDKSRGGKKGSQTTNSTLWEDPDHPELGTHHFNVLKKLQRESGYPCQKENRRKVS